MPTRPTYSMPALTLTRAGFTIRIESPAASDLDWLAENLVPGFESVPHEPASRSLTKIVDPDLHRQLLALGPRTPVQPVSCFCFDGHRGECMPWNAPDTTLYDEELRLFYRMGVDGRRVEVIAPSSRPSARVALLRIIREFSTHHLAGRGSLHIHAACIAHRGRGMLIVGPKRAGKTSLMLHAIADAGSSFIANDRAVVDIDSTGTWRLGGMQTVITIRSGTLELLPCPGLMAARSWFARATLAEAIATASPPPHAARSEPLSISPKQFCHAIGATRIASAALRIIVFPRVDTDRRGIHHEPLTPNATKERLAGHLLRPADTVFCTDVHDARTSAWAADAMARIHESIPGVECVLGRDAFSDTAWLDDILSRADRSTSG